MTGHTLFTVAVVAFIVLVAVMVAFVRWEKMTWSEAMRAIFTPLLLWMGALFASAFPEIRVSAADFIGLADVYLLVALGLASLRRMDDPMPLVALPRTASSTLLKKSFELRRDGAKSTVAADVSAAELFRGEVIIVNGDINAFAAERFARSCHEAIRDGVARVTIQISTQGGLVDYGWSMHEQLRLLSEHAEVWVVVVGPCLSAGVSIIMAVPPERRLATCNSDFAVHAAKCMDTLHPSREQVERLSRDNRRWVVDLICANTAISRSSLEELVRSGRDSYFDAQQALALGVIGGII